MATDCQGGSILPAVYNTNTIKDTTQDSVKPTKTRRNQDYGEDFETLWKIYPRRINKAGAFGAFKATLRRGVSLEDLTTATVAYASSRIGQDEQFTMHASTFFGKAERWRDYLNSGATPATELTELEMISALSYEDWDNLGSWGPADAVCVDNPAKHGYNRPVNKNGQLVDASGNPYVLDSQGLRRPVEYWN